MANKVLPLWRRAGAVAGLALSIALCAMGTASALDYDDVAMLLENDVDENVIMNMVESDSNLYISLEQADELREMGASENLIAAMRPRSTGSGASYTVVEPARPAVSVAPMATSSRISSAEGSPITPAPITMSMPMPARFDKEGWVSVSNRDWQPYYLNIDVKEKRMFLSRHPNGGVLVQSGQNMAFNLRKNTYKLYGDSGEKLEVKIRENEVTTLSLEPFGVFGNSGLTGIVANRDRVRSEVLFSNYVPPPPVVVTPLPPVVVVPAPPPAVIYRRPPYYQRHGGGVFFHYSR